MNETFPDHALWPHDQIGPKRDKKYHNAHKYVSSETAKTITPCIIHHDGNKEKKGPKIQLF